VKNYCILVQGFERMLWGSVLRKGETPLPPPEAATDSGTVLSLISKCSRISSTDTRAIRKQ